MLEVNNLRKTFDDLVAVSNIQFKVDKGEIFGLIGQNGSGKTTTFRMILNLLNPDAGELLWNKRPLRQKDYNQIGYLPEERGLNQKASIENQILYFSEIHGKRKKDIKPKIDLWMDKFQVKGNKNDKIKSLSKGNQQKVQLICTLIFEPELIILDEPFSGLDPVNAELLANGIQEASHNGASIIFSSHNMNNVEELCKQIVMLNKGKQILSGDISEIRDSYGNTKLELKSHLKANDLNGIEGIQTITSHNEFHHTIQLSNPEVGHTIFDKAATTGYIPIFSQNPPSLEDIFKHVVGGNNE